MVTNAMKHMLIISTTTCLFRFTFGEGRRAVRRGKRLPKRAKNDARSPRRERKAGGEDERKMYRSARGLAIPRRRARTHRRDLEPRRVIGVIAEHGHVVPLSGFLRGTATPGVSAPHARCRVTIGTGEIRGKRSVSRSIARGFAGPVDGERAFAREKDLRRGRTGRARGAVREGVALAGHRGAD